MRSAVSVGALSAFIIALTIATSLMVDRPAIGQGPASTPLRVAVVDFAAINQDIPDIEKLNELSRKLIELQRAKITHLSAQIREIQLNLNEYGNLGLGDDIQVVVDAQADLLQAQAELALVEPNFKFRRALIASRYPTDILEKILAKIEAAGSQGRYHLILKVIGDVDFGQEGGSAMAEAQRRLQVGGAREVLYYDRSRVQDITDDILLAMQQDADLEGVSGDIQSEIDALQREINELGG